MSEKILRTLIALAVFFLPTLAEFFVQPAYQVTIMLSFQGGEPIHLCNGCIIYERMIATTANCVHFRLSTKLKPTVLEPSALSVWAGSSNGIRDILKINISAIDVAAGFNIETLENDLALLTLSQPLLLGIRPDMQWIMIDDSEYVNNSCLVNFFLRNSRSPIPNFYQTVELFLYNNAICRNSTTYPLAREADVCSLYVLPQQFSCEEADSFLSFNNDRGSGLICKNYLVGLLSSVVTRPDPEKNCSDVTLTAMYTNIFPHMMWLYSVMNNIETRFISTPYDGSFNPLLAESTLKDYSENEIIAKLSQDSASNLESSITTSSSTMESSTSVTEGSLSESSTVISPIPVAKEDLLSESTQPPQSIDDARDKLDSTNVTSSTVSSSDTTEGPLTSENTTNVWNSTTISSTLVTEEASSEKPTTTWKPSTLEPQSSDNAENQLNSTTTTSSTTILSSTKISSTFPTNEDLPENLTTIRSHLTTEDDARNRSTQTLVNQLSSTTTTISPSSVSMLSSNETKQNSTISLLLGTTEDTTSISPTVATEAEISTTTNISTSWETSLSENETTLPPPSSADATTTSSTTTVSPIHSTDGTASSLNSTTLDPPSSIISTTGRTMNLVTDSSEGIWNATTLSPSPSGNVTISPVTEAVPLIPISTTLPSSSNVQQATNQSDLTNFTADASSEEDITSWNDTGLTTTSTTTFESVEDLSTTTSSKTTTSPLLKAFDSKPTTTTAPSPILPPTKLNFTVLWPLPTVQLEPLKESPHTSIGRLFRSSATTSQLNAFSLLTAFVFLKLIFNQ